MIYTVFINLSQSIMNISSNEKLLLMFIDNKKSLLNGLLVFHHFYLTINWNLTN